VGIALLVLALLTIPWLIPLTRGVSDLRDALIRALGLHVLLLVSLIAGAGWLILRRRLADAFRAWRPWAVGGLLALFTIGLLGFFRPEWQLGGVSLHDVTAGGRLGRTLAGSPLGILVWLASGVAAFAVAFPDAAARAVAAVPVILATIWAWRIPWRVWRALHSLFQFVFPTRPPPRSSMTLPLETTMWARTTGPVADAEDAPPPVSEPDIGYQAELPLRETGGDEEEADEEAEVPAAPAPNGRQAADGWQLPPLDVLADVALQEVGQADNAARAQLIEATLASFGVDCKVVQINEGPTVTQFGIEPGWEVKYRQVPERDAAGKPLLDRDGNPKVRLEEVSRTRVRVNQITALANDLALALAAPSLRIEAPVPGKAMLGIEVPNVTTSLVTLRAVIETPQFRRLSSRSRLALALGKSVSGEPIVADLAKMPHLLIAGATGSGKSVCLNSIIACLLMHASPEEVRMVMIDPKRVELTAFARIPHLAFPIIVDVEKVVGTLQAVIHEMETRYRRFAALAVRNIDAYNRHPKAPTRMPYMVVIIDELADLMMAAPIEVERQVCRLAQLARATGIHLIIATQRPSVDVVTGLIKANFPARIAFAVTSQVDSRTILDMAGAEKLLGRGDMLYLPTDAGKPKRVQGVFVSDGEIERLVDFWTQDRFQGLQRETFDHLFDAVRADEETEMEDPLLERAKELALEHSRISTSLLQRRLRVGYPRAARLMDMLEEAGVVGPAEGGGSREVLHPPFSDDGEE